MGDASQTFTMDSLGNQQQVTTTSNNGTVTPQNETFNSQNEIQTTMPTGVTSLYDANGNMVYIPLDDGSGDYYHATYDAWNNMVGETLVGSAAARCRRLRCRNRAVFL